MKVRQRPQEENILGNIFKGQKRDPEGKFIIRSHYSGIRATVQKTEQGLKITNLKNQQNYAIF